MVDASLSEHTRDPDLERHLGRRHQSLCRKMASAILHAMAEVDVTFEEMDGRLEMPATFCRNCLLRLIDGDSVSLRDLSDLVHALGCEVSISIMPKEGGEIIPF